VKEEERGELDIIFTLYHKVGFGNEGKKANKYVSEGNSSSPIMISLNNFGEPMAKLLCSTSFIYK